MANALAFVPFVMVTLFIYRMPISWYAIGFILQVMLTTGVRMSYRFVNLLRSRQEHNDLKNRVLVIGAGAAGQMLIPDTPPVRISFVQIAVIIGFNLLMGLFLRSVFQCLYEWCESVNKEWTEA